MTPPSLDRILRPGDSAWQALRPWNAH